MASTGGAAVVGVGLAVVTSAVFALAALILGGLWVWGNAPVVGGEWWFYIRIGATIIGAVLLAKVGAFVGYVAGMVVGGILGGLMG